MSPMKQGDVGEVNTGCEVQGSPKMKLLKKIIIAHIKMLASICVIYIMSKTKLSKTCFD